MHSTGLPDIGTVRDLAQMCRKFLQNHGCFHQKMRIHTLNALNSNDYYSGGMSFARFALSLGLFLRTPPSQGE